MSMIRLESPSARTTSKQACAPRECTVTCHMTQHQNEYLRACISCVGTARTDQHAATHMCVSVHQPQSADRLLLWAIVAKVVNALSAMSMSVPTTPTMESATIKSAACHTLTEPDAFENMLLTVQMIPPAQGTMPRVTCLVKKRNTTR